MDEFWADVVARTALIFLSAGILVALGYIFTIVFRDYPLEAVAGVVVLIASFAIAYVVTRRDYEG